METTNVLRVRNRGKVLVGAEVEAGEGSTHLEQYGRRDQIDHVSRATVAGAVAGDRATTPIAISSESSSELSSDESLESIGTLMRRW